MMLCHMKELCLALYSSSSSCDTLSEHLGHISFNLDAARYIDLTVQGSQPPTWRRLRTCCEYRTPKTTSSTNITPGQGTRARMRQLTSRNRPLPEYTPPLLEHTLLLLACRLSKCDGFWGDSYKGNNNMAAAARYTTK
jgi:hypothetical protein